MKVLAICGAAGSGKSTVANDLCSSNRVLKMSMADPIRRMLEALGLDISDTTDEIQKRSPNDILCGQTPRMAMQTLGTEWGRNTIGTSIWTKQAVAGVRRANALGYEAVIFDDVRFQNEINALAEFDCSVLRIRRPSVEQAPIAGVHQSEAEWANLTPVIGEVYNTGSYGNLFTLAREALRKEDWLFI